MQKQIYKNYDTVNWLLFVMYKYSPFSSMSEMTNLRIDE